MLMVTPILPQSACSLAARSAQAAAARRLSGRYQKLERERASLPRLGQEGFGFVHTRLEWRVGIKASEPRRDDALNFFCIAGQQVLDYSIIIHGSA